MIAAVISARLARKNRSWFSSASLDNFIVLSVMPLLAACGLIYEYLLSHYAGLMVGNVETAIFIMIGVMLMSAGMGSLISRRVKNPYAGLAWLEVTIGVLGISSLLIIAAAVALLNNALVIEMPRLVAATPYGIGLIMGFLIGIEMPMVVRIREDLPGVNNSQNAATVYAADCIGVALGTSLWAYYLQYMDATVVTSITAGVNVLAGLAFYFRFQRHVKYKHWLLTLHLVAAALIVVVFHYGPVWQGLLALTQK